MKLAFFSQNRLLVFRGLLGRDKKSGAPPHGSRVQEQNWQKCACYLNKLVEPLTSALRCLLRHPAVHSLLQRCWQDVQRSCFVPAALLWWDKGTVVWQLQRFHVEHGHTPWDTCEWLDIMQPIRIQDYNNRMVIFYTVRSLQALTHVIGFWRLSSNWPLCCRGCPETGVNQACRDRQDPLDDPYVSKPWLSNFIQTFTKFTRSRAFCFVLQGSPGLPGIAGEKVCELTSFMCVVMWHCWVLMLVLFQGQEGPSPVIPGPRGQKVKIAD